MFNPPGSDFFASDWRWPSRRHRQRDPLAPFYASGTILAHYSTSAVTRNVESHITGFKNLGGAGQVLDAPVVGPALVQQGPMVIFPADAAIYVETPVALDLVGVRLMWLMDGAAIVHGTRIFGHAGEPQSFINVTQNESGRTLVLNIAGQAGLPLNPRAHWPTGRAIYELEITPSQQRFWINGTLYGSRTGTLSVPAFPLSRIGSGNAALLPFAGPLGEIIAPIIGQPDSAAAIAAARALLTARQAAA